MTIANLHKLQQNSLTLVDYLVSRVLQNAPSEWPRFVVRNVSERRRRARTVFLIPRRHAAHLFEREVSKESLHARLRNVIATLLNEARSVFDIVLIDCPPGLSVLTESWLREADFHISPTKGGLRFRLWARGVPPFQGAEPEKWASPPTSASSST